MASSLYQQLNQNATPTNNIMNMINSLKQSKNPMQTLMNLASKDNSVLNVLKEVQANGGNAKALFFKKAQQMGIDPNTILNKLM